MNQISEGLALSEAIDRLLRATSPAEAGSAPLPASVLHLARGTRLHARPEFVDGLRERLAQAAVEMAPSPATGANRPARHRFAWLAAAAAAALLVAGTIAFLQVRDCTQEVSAAGILDRARHSAALASQESPSTFTMTVRHTLWANVEQPDGSFSDRPLHRVELRRWVEQPDRWRTELWFLNFDSTGTPGGTEMVQLFVGDGETISKFNRGVVEHSAYGGAPSVNTSLDLGTLTERFGGDSIDAILQRISECRTPSLRGTEIVGERPAYVIDLGDDRCAERTGSRHVYAPATVWIDAETFMSVRWLGRSDSPNTCVVSELAEFVPGATIDPARFEFTTPVAP